MFNYAIEVLDISAKECLNKAQSKEDQGYLKDAEDFRITAHSYATAIIELKRYQKLEEAFKEGYMAALSASGK